MGKYQTKEDIEVKLFFEENEATEENINKFIGLKKSENADIVVKNKYINTPNYT